MGFFDDIVDTLYGTGKAVFAYPAAVGRSLATGHDLATSLAEVQSPAFQLGGVSGEKATNYGGAIAAGAIAAGAIAGGAAVALAVAPAISGGAGSAGAVVGTVASKGAALAQGTSATDLLGALSTEENPDESTDYGDNSSGDGSYDLFDTTEGY